ncbi:glycosyltransferase family 2 protein [Acinetobacter johnsonii]|uniref:glycosyltransferase family 2 protein n=1 Tax=Acinetobacter johnsonii TaxID=40214 RepID=UPI001F1E6078|nr:glycosyltransferase family 2 protein [Acinetobacter johnsonii]UIZ99533.1 glycosyltransferase [Acinetobacter johnsonii]
MPKDIFVTIAIPFYNAEETILDAVRSVFAQTHENWELLLIDDGSNDKSLELVQGIKDPRVSIYSDGKNLKLAARLNQIVDLAKYDYIARMDADDLMSPDRIEKLISILINENYDLVSCGTYSIKMNNSYNGYRGSYEEKYSFEGILNKSQKFLHAGLIARKSWYQRNRYNEQIPVGQDTHLWLSASKALDFNAKSISDPLYMYREEGNVTVKKLMKAYQVERDFYAPMIDNTLFKYKYMTKSWLKTLIVKTMSIFGSLDYLLSRRNKSKIDENLIEYFNASLKKINSVKIPGVDNG